MMIRYGLKKKLCSPDCFDYLSWDGATDLHVDFEPIDFFLKTEFFLLVPWWRGGRSECSRCPGRPLFRPPDRAGPATWWRAAPGRRPPCWSEESDRPDRKRCRNRRVDDAASADTPRSRSAPSGGDPEAIQSIFQLFFKFHFLLCSAGTNNRTLTWGIHLFYFKLSRRLISGYPKRILSYQALIDINDGIENELVTH